MPSHPASLSAVSCTDALTLRDATIGDGVILDRPAGGGFELLEVRQGAATLLGTYADLREAWAAIDVLDLAALAGEAQAARLAA